MMGNPASRIGAGLLLLGWLAPAAASNLGAVVAYEKTTHGIAGRTAAAEFAVEVWSPQVIRVRVTPQDSTRKVGYALVPDTPPDGAQFSVSASDAVVSVKTSGVTAEVELRPDLRITFKDAGGQVINEDLPGKELGLTLVGNKITVYKRLQSDERFIGMGEQLGNLDRRGSVLTLKNTDNYRYDDPKVPMYVSIPFFMGLHHGKVYGLFFNNSYRSVFNFGASNRRFASFSFDGGALDQFFIFDASVRKILEHYTSLTGRMPLPPRWSLGYQQSRCSYYPEMRPMPVCTSSKINSRSLSSHSLRRARRNSGAATRTPPSPMMGSIRMAAVRSPTARFVASRSPNGTWSKPSTAGPKPSRYFCCPPAASAASVRPWKAPSKVMIRNRSDLPLAD